MVYLKAWNMPTTISNWVTVGFWSYRVVSSLTLKKLKFCKVKRQDGVFRGGEYAYNISNWVTVGFWSYRVVSSLALKLGLFKVGLKPGGPVFGLAGFRNPVFGCGFWRTLGFRFRFLSIP